MSASSPLISRRSLLGGSLAGSAALLGFSPWRTIAQSATPIAGESLEMLAVADPEAAILSFFRLADLAPVGRLDGVAVNAHVGFIPLADGRLLFMDDLGKRLIAIAIQNGEVAQSEAPISGEAFSHIAVDGGNPRFAAVGSDDPAAPVTLVNLEDWSTTPLALAEAGEVGLFLTADHLFHRNDVSNQIEAYSLDALLQGTIEIASSIQIGAFGHGESISSTGDRLYSATDDGIDAATWDGSELAYLTTYSWESADQSGGRGYFQRLTSDDRTIISYTADRSAPEPEWPTWSNDAVLVDIASGETHRIELGGGYVFRFGLGGNRALFTRIGEEGDEAIILDLERKAISERIPLEPMSTGPVAGASIYETNQYRAVTASNDGRLGFVTQGGDGLVIVLDLTAESVMATIDAGTPLNGGGHLGVFGAATSFSDTIGR